MNKLYTHQLLSQGQLTRDDIELVTQRRRSQNRLGFAYQLAFVRLHNRFPTQRPTFKIGKNILTFVGVQLDVDTSLIETYTKRQPTMSEHQLVLINAFLDHRSH